MKEKKAKQETGLMPTAEARPMPFGGDPFGLFPGFTPFSLMRNFTDNMERFFEDFNRFPMMPPFEADLELPKLKKFQKTMWAPQIEILEKDGQFIMKADLPGLRKEDVEIQLEENALIISGERNLETKKEDEGYFRSERNYGSFYRRIPLPEAFDPETAHATFKDGVLEVMIAIPKKEPIGKKIEITDEPKARVKSA